MKVVIDTNILVAALPSRSKHFWVIEAFLDERFEWIVSTEILLEYEEILRRKYSSVAVDNFFRAMKDAPNVHIANAYYRWNLLMDEDDNKFSDLAIASNADYLVSEDGDFRRLKLVGFPKVAVLRLAEFHQILNQN